MMRSHPHWSLLIGAALFVAAMATSSSGLSPLALAAQGGPDQSIISSQVYMPMALNRAANPAASGHGPVVFQVATAGRGTQGTPNSFWPAMTPWFTLYADGTYFRVHPDLQTVEIERRTGRLDASTLNALVTELTDEIEFFELAQWATLVHTDSAAPTDYLYLRTTEHSHRVQAFGLTSMQRFPRPLCPFDDRFVQLADFIAGLTTPLSDNEVEYTIESGYMVIFGTRPDPDAPKWPVSEIVLGEPYNEPLRGQLAVEVAQAISEHATTDPRHARFREGDATWWVGFVVTFPGWLTYGPAPPSMPLPCGWPIANEGK